MADQLLTLPTYQERVNFYGANGSGKSVLAAHMLSAGQYDYVAIDSKGDFSPPGEPVVIHSPEDPRWRRGFRHIVYRPDMGHNDGRALDEQLMRLFARGKSSGRRHPFVVYVDEALYLSKTGRTRWLAALAVAGRSMGIGLWCSSQRPKWIPVEVRSEAWRQYVFFLGQEADEEEILLTAKGAITLADLRSNTVDHAFLELRRGHGGQVGVRRFPPLRIAEEAGA